jgi:Protein of unknown function (DUF3102)
MTTELARSNSLTDLAARIRAEHEACGKAFQRGLAHAIAAGKLLLEARDQIPHGQWLNWLRESCQIPERTARRYMEIAPWAVPESKSAILADLTGEAVSALAVPRPLDQAESWEEMSAWVQRHYLDAPFRIEDCDDHDWLRTKLLHQIGVPPMAAFCLGSEDDLPPLRLCPFDELLEAMKLLAPLCKKKPQPGFAGIAAEGQCDLQEIAVVVVMDATRLLGRCLVEYDHRKTKTDQQLETESNKVLARMMARIEAKIAAHEASRS